MSWNENFVANKGKPQTTNMEISAISPSSLIDSREAEMWWRIVGKQRDESHATFPSWKLKHSSAEGMW